MEGENNRFDNSQKEIVFKATTIQEAKQISNPLNEELVSSIFESVKKSGNIDLSRNFYNDNQWEKKYSSDTTLQNKYYEDFKRTRDHLISDFGFSYSEPGLAFGQFDSPQVIKRMKDRSYKQPTVRIYLNPHPEDTFKIFNEIQTKILQNDLAIQSKVSGDAFTTNSGLAHRDDRIVIYTDDEQADKTLSIIQGVYKQFAGNFIDSKIPIVATELAPGLGVAAEKNIKDKNGEKYSASSYREVLLSRIFSRIPSKYQEMVKKGTYNSDLVKKFLMVSKNIFAKVGIDNTNWSFYK